MKKKGVGLCRICVYCAEKVNDFVWRIGGKLRLVGWPEGGGEGGILGSVRRLVGETSAGTPVLRGTCTSGTPIPARETGPILRAGCGP